MALAAEECVELKHALKGKATNYRYSDVARWLQRGDFVEPRGATGSHRVWTHSGGRRVQLVDHGAGELLPVYVKRAFRTIREANGCPE